VITGRGPGAPGLTPGGEFPRGRVPAGNPGDGAVDLSEIRRSEEIIDVLAARAATSTPMLRDPAVALLSALTADVDTRDDIRDDLPDTLPGSPLLRVAAAAISVRASLPGIAAWVRATAASAVVAGVAGTTSVVAAGMLARLARGPASGSRRLTQD
jgi:hypothetical protein